MMRIGIAIEAGDVPAWQAAAVERMRSLDFLEIEVFAVVEPGSIGALPPACALLSRTDDRGRPGGPDPLAGVEPGRVIGTIDRIALEPRSAESVARACGDIRARKLDGLVSFVNPGIFGACGTLARLGTWFFDDSFGPASSGALAGAREVLDREPCLVSELRVRLPDGSGDRVAYATCSSVHPASHFRTRNEHLWKCSAIVTRALAESRHAGPPGYLSTLEAAGQDRPAWSTASQYASLARYVAWRAWRKFTKPGRRERWILLRAGRDEPIDLGRLRPLVPPTGRFWADPHAIASEGMEYVFFEDASCTTGKGHISVVARRDDGSLTEPVPVVERPYHLSYPFVFQWNHDWYMIPESAENRTIELYRCTRFPDRWTFVHNLKEGIRAFDSTLVEHAGRWWMFANVAGHEGASSWDELCIFHADSPLSRDWQPHAANPVVSDVRRARPAGPFFRRDGVLMRPSQDSSGRYGRALHVNRVDELSVDRYRETTIRTIEPDPRASYFGVHSLSSAGDGIYLDAIWREPQ